MHNNCMFGLTLDSWWTMNIISSFLQVKRYWSCRFLSAIMLVMIFYRPRTIMITNNSCPSETLSWCRRCYSVWFYFSTWFSPLKLGCQNISIVDWLSKKITFIKSRLVLCRNYVRKYGWRNVWCEVQILGSTVKILNHSCHIKFGKLKMGSFVLFFRVVQVRVSLL